MQAHTRGLLIQRFGKVLLQKIATQQGCFTEMGFGQASGTVYEQFTHFSYDLDHQVIKTKTK